jgi:hypothetical protein
MGMIYLPGFDMSVYPNTSFSLIVQGISPAQTQVTVTAADIYTALGSKKCFMFNAIDTIYPHMPSGYQETFDYSDAWSSIGFLEALHDALKLKTDAASWPTHINFTWGYNGRLTASSDNGTQTFSLVYSTIDTALMLDIAATAVTTATGPYQAKYCVPVDIDYIADSSGLYQSERISSVAVPASGAEPFGMSRGFSSTYHDFTQRGEIKSTMYGETTSACYFGLDFLFDHCRRGYPFIVYTGSAQNGVYFFRSDAVFKPKMMFDNFDDFWEVDFKTIYLGYVGYE